MLLSGACRQHDDFDRACFGIVSQRAYKPKAIQIWHHYIGYHKIRSIQADGGKRLLSICHGFNVVIRRQQAGDISAKIGVIVCYQYART